MPQGMEHFAAEEISGTVFNSPPKTLLYWQCNLQPVKAVGRPNHYWKLSPHMFRKAL